MTPQEEWTSLGYDEGTLPHRELLAEKVGSYLFKTLLDVGCASGPDIALLNILYPEIRCYGFDRTTEDIEKAATTNPAADFWVADIKTHLKEIPDKSYGVVMSNGVMMYHDPKLVHELTRIAKKAVIMSERDPDGKLLMEASQYPKLITTKITSETRDSWKEDGFIYEICLDLNFGSPQNPTT